MFVSRCRLPQTGYKFHIPGHHSMRAQARDILSTAVALVICMEMCKVPPEYKTYRGNGMRRHTTGTQPSDNDTSVPPAEVVFSPGRRCGCEYASGSRGMAMRQQNKASEIVAETICRSAYDVFAPMPLLAAKPSAQPPPCALPRRYLIDDSQPAMAQSLSSHRWNFTTVR